jgi:membrane protein involved in colicin uptake
MQFSSPGNGSASVRVKIKFTVAGSQYDRAAREAQEQRERAERERKEQEAARQQQLEQERQARQEQLERERQARQEQLQQQQESAPPNVDTQPAPKPLPSLSEEELDAERLRKFRERMEQYQKQ